MSPIVEAIRWMRAAPDRWYQTTAGGAWYLDVGDRVAIVFGSPGRWWWRCPGARGRRTRSVRRAMLEAQRAAAAWILRGGFRPRSKRRPPIITSRSFIPDKAARAVAAASYNAAPP